MEKSRVPKEPGCEKAHSQSQCLAPVHQPIFEDCSLQLVALQAGVHLNDARGGRRQGTERRRTASSRHDRSVAWSQADRLVPKKSGGQREGQQCTCTLITFTLRFKELGHKHRDNEL